MQLVERHIIKPGHIFYEECDRVCFLSKNLYNKGLYDIRQHYFETGKYLNYKSNYKSLRYQYDYEQLPDKVSKQTLRLLDKNFASFFASMGSYKKNPEKFEAKPKIPKYLDTTDGRYMVRYEKGALGKRSFNKNGLIRLSQTDIYVNTQIKDWESIDEVRIACRNGYYIIEVVYTKEVVTYPKSDLIASIDVGLNNLMTVTFSDGTQPVIINGRPLKSINQFYNKRVGRLKSEIKKKQDKFESKATIKLTNKRDYKITDYLHKSTRLLVNLLASKDVSTLVVGWNQGMKQDINIGRVNNQNFSQIPFHKLIGQLRYKCKLEGIEVIEREESYTSKCSFMDLEPIDKQDKYLGRRVKRGLFKCSSGKKINADVNGSYNIMRKEFPNIFTIEGIEGVAVHPLKLMVSQN